jgi:hypothetical protein
MSNSGNPLVDKHSKITVDTYYESPDRAYAEAHDPLGYAVGTWDMTYMRGEGEDQDDYSIDGHRIHGSGWLAGLPLVDDSMGYAQAIVDAEHAFIEEKGKNPWDDALAVVGVIAGAAGVTADIAGAVDPAGLVVEYAVSWALTHVRPLRMALDGLTGNADVIGAYSTSWNNIATLLGQVSDQFKGTLQTGPGPWEGDAYNAYLGMAATTAAALDSAATQAQAMADLTKAVGDIVAGVQLLVKAVISAAVSSMVDVGELLFGDPEQGGPGLEAKGAELISKTLRIIKELTKFLEVLGPLSGALSNAVGAIESAAKDYVDGA